MLELVRRVLTLALVLSVAGTIATHELLEDRQEMLAIHELRHCQAYWAETGGNETCTVRYDPSGGASAGLFANITAEHERSAREEWMVSAVIGAPLSALSGVLAGLLGAWLSHRRSG